MNGVRAAISIFILVVIAVLVRGWIWTGQHQTAPQAAASHVVLALGIAATIIGLAALWRRPAR
jgi:hypothetical protein